MAQSNLSMLTKVAPWLVGSILGALFVLAFTKPSPTNTTDSLGADIAALASAVSQLDGKVERLNISFLEEPRHISKPLERSPLDTPTAKELLSRLTSLETTLSNLGESVGNLAGDIRSIENPPRRSAVDGLNASVWSTMTMKIGTLTSLLEQNEADRAARVHGLSYKQVMDEFGTPSSVSSGSGGLSFNYSRLPNNGTVSLTFQEDRVVRCRGTQDVKRDPCLSCGL